MKEVAPAVFCLETDYPVLADAPLFVHMVGRDEPALIDAAEPTTYDAVLRHELIRAGVRLADIRWVVLTHAHPDHIGGAPTLRAAGGRFQVAAPVDDVPWVESPQRQWREFWGAHPGVLDMAPRRATTLASCGDGIRVDRPLRDGEQLVLGVRRLRVLRTGAHTPGHCAYLDEEAGVLFTGDAVAGRGIPAVSGATVFPPMYDDLDDHVRGLRLLRDLDFDVMCPAHHPPVDRPGGLGLIDDSLALAAEIEALVDGMLPARSRSLATVDVAAAIGRHVGMDPPVSPHTVRTASAHLRAAAARGQLSPAWIGAV